MSINVAKLELAMMQKINNASTEFELLTYQKVLEQLRTGSVNNVSTYANLPTYSENVGKLYFVESEDSVYWANATAGWVELEKKTLTKLYSWGFNCAGVLGTNNTINYSSPVQEISSSDWHQVSVGCIHAGGIKSDSTLWSWGCGAFGALANNIGVNITRCSPIQEITCSTYWSAINYGQNHSIAIKCDGTMWVWGRNTNGQLGTNNIVCYSSPIQEITSNSNWSFISRLGGYNTNSTLAIKTDGTLWGFGMGGSGRLGTNDVTNYSSPVQEISSSTNWTQVATEQSGSIGLKGDGTMWVWGTVFVTNEQSFKNYSSPVQEISSSTNWCYVQQGLVSNFGIKTDGSLWGAGTNTYGQLGTNSGIEYSSPVQEISSSTNWCLMSSTLYSSAAIKTDGTLWAWGQNNCGQAGTNNLINYSSPVQETSTRTNWSFIKTSGAFSTIALENFSF